MRLALGFIRFRHNLDPNAVASHNVHCVTYGATLKTDYGGRNSIVENTMGESQAHGFAFEREIREKVFGLSGKSNYTGTHDIPKSDNKFDPNENISIKTAQLSSRGNATVCLGSAARISAYSSESKHTAIVVVYTQQGPSKVVAEILEILLDNRTDLFGGVPMDEILDLERMICVVPKHAKPVALIRAIHAKKCDMNKRSGIVKFNPKIDGKTQRRLQCSIPGIYTHPEFFRIRTSEPVVRGVRIAGSIASSVRARREKTV